jgi:hypothetical protein
MLTAVATQVQDHTVRADDLDTMHSASGLVTAGRGLRVEHRLRNPDGDCLNAMQVGRVHFLAIDEHAKGLRLPDQMQISAGSSNLTHHRSWHAACTMVIRNERLLAYNEEPPLGAHLIAPRLCFAHHGI